MHKKVKVSKPEIIGNDQKPPKDMGILGYGKGFFILQLSFLFFLTFWQILHGIFPSLEMILILLILMLIWRAQHRALLRDLLPFLILLISFQGLRDFADNLSTVDIHVTDLIFYEKFLFSGVIPAYYLQTNLTNLPYSQVIGVIASIFYMSHFVVPIIVAMILWRKNKSLYWNFITGLLILSYLGFITYVFYPAAPPWWATQYGFLIDQPVYVLSYSMPAAIQVAGPNPVAAMPSLHMAYSTYIIAFCMYVWGKRMSWLIIIPLGVAFATMFLGHHYVIDLIAGVVYALVVLALILLWKKYYSQFKKNSQAAHPGDLN